MSAAPKSAPPAPLDLADATMEFVLAFGAWMQRASFANAGESVARLRLLNELHCNGPRKMADLADRLGVTPRNVTALVDALEGEGLVRRADHPTDRRVTMIEITGGSTTVEQQMASVRRSIADLLSGASDEDRAAFARVLMAVKEKIDPTRGGSSS
jgi:DNA-binding MarR family transcriptional regulator